MRRTPAFVFPKSDRDFRSPRAQLRSLDHKLRSEFHPVAAHIHAVKYSRRKSAHPAMGIANSRMKKQIQQRGQSGISNVLVMPRHCARLDLSGKTIAHHHFAALAPLRNESR